MSESFTTPPKNFTDNPVVKLQLAHRSIRAYQDRAIPEAVLADLFEAARHTATSAFLQQFSIIHITDPQVREAIYQVSGQPYVGGDKGELFIFVADLNRNARIREHFQADLSALSRTNLFLEAAADTYLAAQNFVLAAESHGLGTVYLGSIQTDPARLVEVLELPRYTYPLLGVLVGYADQEPQYKPRLPLEFLKHQNTYQGRQQLVADLGEYDQHLQSYYDLRDISKPVGAFTKRIASMLGQGAAEQSPMLAVLHQQGLCLE
ncbi:hypothetical protein BSR28_06725 [Boudabousia liubingyangii]|uniref:nitroreductase family protein n=1 Tax=Boudabousia liubingyangii TaxID=1921764 RepID=UPI00093CE10F|nr:nitroreductase family protein [Boudabousia liubingyangii]OKL47093.1 hypothetical protein BSR28_06725 [Boudabousia liubingyangii]